ncbi:MAG: AMP-binding protein [Bacteroidaceae bacterium]|nr:AMP-binding protein [Bacteroidaceae bacterium]
MTERTRLFDASKDSSLIDLIERSIKENWSKPAYTDYGTEINYTFGDVALDIARLHTLYAKYGIQKGDKIALCEKNSTHWAVAFLSIITYGAVAVPILADFSVEQIVNIYQHSESKLLISGRNTFDIKETLNIVDWHFFEDSEKYADIYAAMNAVSVTKESVNYDREDGETLAALSYTSGSTGRSKGVMLPYRSLWSNVIFADERLGLPKNSRTLAILPMAHMYGFAFDFMYEFCIGAHVHFLTKVPSPAIVIKAFNEVKPAIVIAVPLIIEKIVIGKVFPVLKKPIMRVLTKVPFLRRIIYNKIKAQLENAFGGNFYEVIIGGAAFSKEVEDLLRKIHFRYTVGYGMTECGPIICYEDYGRFRKGSCGKPAPRMEVRILSDNPHKVAGEIVTRGTNVMLGYYKNPEETAEAIDAEGWLHTGDLGTMDKNGNVFIRGRKKTMLLGANGQNVYPEEIEDVILSQGIFEETVVVQRGEKLVALAYISETRLKENDLTMDEVKKNLNTYRNELNLILPKFANLASIEMMSEPFEKTPKQSIRRYLYK